MCSAAHLLWVFNLIYAEANALVCVNVHIVF